MDLWLWRNVKSNVYQFQPQTLSDVKDAIRTPIQEIPTSMVNAAVLSTNCRMQSAIVYEAGHMENL